MKLLYAVVLVGILLGGCSSKIQEVKKQYTAIKGSITLGESRERVMEAFRTYHESWNCPKCMRESETYMEDENKVDIFFVRTDSSRNNRIHTDDKYTPYIFYNDALVGIGWTMLGGPKTQEPATHSTSVIVQPPQQTYTPPPPVRLPSSIQTRF